MMLSKWEYAARSGGKPEIFAGTNDHDELGFYAWYGPNSNNTTHPVGTRRPNGFRLNDMNGSVRSTARTSDPPDLRNEYDGFRLLLPPVKKTGMASRKKI